ncbi:MAG: hypothetical protein KME47_10150 [Nodosilinea sp. WJT8-NPBG4]|jgi:HD-like signal output (HDOD) protein|nr:hypothetical protein [Nodosilinea sp. WJT8-NPBG4]
MQSVDAKPNQIYIKLLEMLDNYNPSLDHLNTLVGQDPELDAAVMAVYPPLD